MYTLIIKKNLVLFRPNWLAMLRPRGSAPSFRTGGNWVFIYCSRIKVLLI